MTLRAKKIIAREVLIILIPMLLQVLMIFGLDHYYRANDKRIQEQIDVVGKKMVGDAQDLVTYKRDSTRIADSVVYAKIKPHWTPPEDKIKANETELLDAVMSSPLQGKMDSLKNIQEQNSTSRHRNLIYFDSDVFGWYVVFLILVYPIRLLIITIIWAVKTLKQ